MIWIYRIIFLPALLIALPYYGLRMWRRGGYGKDFQHRLGRFRRLDPPAPGKRRIWVQAVSVGEVHAISPLVEALGASGRFEIVLTTTTSTGYAEACKRYGDTVLATGIFPLDFWFFSRAAWKRIRPDALILTESELWPEHLHRAGKNGIPAFLVNARLSERSYRRYRKFPRFARGLLSHFDRIFASSEPDAKRLVRLGAPKDRVLMTGNLKFDVPLDGILDEAGRLELRRALGFSAGGDKELLVLLGSSTWPGEETALLHCQDALLAAGIDCRLLLVPRHAERGPELRALLDAKRPGAWFQRSSGGAPEGDRLVHLADTTGELRTLTQAADLAFIGKSLPPNEGGQTPIEAAGLGVPVVFGPAMSNFKAVSRSLLESGAARRVRDEADLIRAIGELAANASERHRMGASGRAWHATNRGSSERIAHTLLERLRG